MIRDIQMLLEKWGGWAAGDSSGVDYSPTTARFKGLLPQTDRSRPSCTDDDALIIEGCLARLENRRPYERSLLVAHYLYGISKRKIARVHKKDKKLIRIKMQMARGSIDGRSAMFDVRLEMDD